MPRLKLSLFKDSPYSKYPIMFRNIITVTWSCKIKNYSFNIKLRIGIKLNKITLNNL